MDLRRLARRHELDEQPNKAKRIVEVREVAGIRKDLEPAARDESMRRARVLDRDDRVALAPDEQKRNRLGELLRGGGEAA